MKKSHKQILLDAGRYDGVLDILEKIYNTTDSDFPTPTLVRCSESSGRVSGPDVRQQARKLIKCLEYEKDPGTTSEYDSLLEYVESHVDIALHNYANNISHRKEPYEDMEDIRTWSVLRSLITELVFQHEEWEISEGWKVLPDTPTMTM